MKQPESTPPDGSAEDATDGTLDSNLNEAEQAFERELRMFTPESIDPARLENIVSIAPIARHADPAEAPDAKPNISPSDHDHRQILAHLSPVTRRVAFGALTLAASLALVATLRWIAPRWSAEDRDGDSKVAVTVDPANESPILLPNPEVAPATSAAALPTVWAFHQALRAADPLRATEDQLDKYTNYRVRAGNVSLALR